MKSVCKVHKFKNYIYKGSFQQDQIIYLSVIFFQITTIHIITIYTKINTEVIPNYVDTLEENPGISF